MRSMPHARGARTPRPGALDEDRRMKVATWNVNGIRAREAQVLELVARERPDVLCLQEIKAPPARVPATLCALEGYHCLWHGETAYSGVGLHVRRELAPE